MSQQFINNMRNDTDLKLEDKADDETHNLWLDILSQVQESSQNKLPSCKTVLVLGDNESGKTSLIAKLQSIEDPKKGSGLEFHYLFINDEYRDDSTRLSIWVLDGDPWHRNLLKYALNDQTFPDTTILITASMTQPWDLLHSLESWAKILEEHIQRLRIPEEQMKQYRDKVNKRFNEYSEPGTDIDISKSVDSLLSSEIEINLGLDIIVVITKTDYMSTLEKDYDLKEEHFDFIQLSIRKFCLLYGASLFYVSVKEDKNCDLLLKYIVHRVYNFPFRTPALVVEKDAVFIPSGWDNQSKMNILEDNLSSMGPDDPFNEVIVKPLNRKPLQREAEISAEDDQAFLVRLQNLMNQQMPAAVGRPVTTQEASMRTPPGVQKTGERRISGPPGMQASPKKIEGKAGTVGGEGVLQNFFNSLLNRKTGSPIGGPLGVRTPPTSDKLPPRTTSDPVSEYERLSGKNKKASTFSESEDSLGESPATKS